VNKVKAVFAQGFQRIKAFALPMPNYRRLLGLTEICCQASLKIIFYNAIDFFIFEQKRFINLSVQGLPFIRM